MKNNFSKISILLSIIIFIMACGSFLYIYNEINKHEQAAEAATQTWQTEENRRDQIISLDNFLKKITKDRANLDNHFIQSSDVVPFLDSMEKIAVPVGVKVETQSVDAGVKNNGLTVTLKATGSFEAVYKYLTLLENSPYEINFLSMDLHKLTADTSATKDVNSNWEATFKIQLLSYLP